MDFVWGANFYLRHLKDNFAKILNIRNEKFADANNISKSDLVKFVRIQSHNCQDTVNCMITNYCGRGAGFIDNESTREQHWCK